MLDLVNFWEVVMFSWIMGNSDMHLKNFSLISKEAGNYVLSQAYDLINVHLVFPEDTEELALTLDGRKKTISRNNFVRAMESSGLESKVIDNIIKKFMNAAPKWYDFINISFLSQELREQYIAEISSNLAKL
jgi:serine/threonine-protein kinase HipA